ncbi:MAG: hypothetical protein MJ200_02435 [Mycoplasmoidaceae bacterium]|nr:hypothetical protein [Mycoplasmoidaceae bacterium]
MKQHFVVDPRIYYDKNASYNYGEVFFEYTDSTFPTDNKVTLRIPENCGYSFSPSSIVTTIDVALDSTKASQVYSAKIYVATGHDLEEKNIDVEFNAQFSGTNHQRTFKTSIIDLDEKGLLFDLPEGG